ncbi:MAG: putative Mg2+ transporter-C (MgtC) family protein [Candidatus Binatota bacterium]|nr:putative Mg2+ transporter-C (MgtC) family protein [Candidatus Binatota bacterium]
MADLVEILHLALLSEMLLAAVLGGLIGLERELSGKPAGLRTNMLICMGSALAMEISEHVARAAGTDPGRIAAQVISGVGFIGAGTIMVARGHGVVGLTTAATIWVVAAVGLAVGAHAYVDAIGTTFLVVLVLFGLGRLEHRFVSRNQPEQLDIGFRGTDHRSSAVAEKLRELGLDARVLRWEETGDGIDLGLEIRGSADARDRAVAFLVADPTVRRVARAGGEALHLAAKKTS